ncbi:heavy metal translocating P-type ATPase [Leptospira kmetyi]|uniref:heavy metal translocating P-type ATPase n=1 Tax=Leptospira kmetyi TaxID=408139 RepID=UPI0010839C90|nr:heavy metal translocating P-type ATPase [Leptospira kmetyi]TGK12739.1 cadmium-translocating P-type ATPase [Leptospira kmetyi]TGK29293.1 cadmium-translocating P-type ATPase [Leptospira kmetyi]
MQTLTKIEARCYHCNTPIRSEKEIIYGELRGNRETFCCSGCRSLATLLVENGLTRFYDLRGSETLEPVSGTKLEREDLETESVYEEYVIRKENGICETSITIGKIHCSACVWLNEKVLSEQEGVLETRINFATGRMKLVYDRNRIDLNRIFAIIRRIGYEPSLYSPLKAETKVGLFSKDLFLRMALAGFSWGNIMLFSIGLYAGYFTGIEMEFKRLFHYVSWIFATPVYLYSGYPFYKGAIESVKRRILSMDTLLFSGVSLAYFYSVYVTLSDKGEVYFDSVCTIYFFILIGKFLESAIRLKAGRKIGELLSTLPEEYTVIQNGTETSVSPSKIRKEDSILLKNGNRVPVDGILKSEIAYFDESFLTGESKPVTHKSGDTILSGSLCLSSNVLLTAITTAKESTLSRISSLIETSLQAKPGIQRTTDKFSTYFIQAVLAIALATFCIFGFYYENWEKAVLNTISVLIVACPCALGLAVPAAYVVSNLLHGSKGILVKNPDSLEILSRADRIYFDKTGTLTLGKLSIQEEWFLNPEDKSKLYSIVISMESSSTHPLAVSLTKEIEKKLDSLGEQADPIAWKELKEIPGNGIEATALDETSTYRIGNRNFVTKGQNPQDGKIHLGKNGQILASFSLEDTVRPEAESTIQKLKTAIRFLGILSGDSKSNVETLARRINIQHSLYELKPEEKLRVIQKAQSQGETVVMVGDGINDSACLAAANLGVSMGIASDLSIDKSDLVLLSNRLDSLVSAVLISQKTRRIIFQNILISLTYNSVMLPLAAFGFMLPVICAGFMTLSSLSVVLNSISLQWRTKL